VLLRYRVQYHIIMLPALQHYNVKAVFTINNTLKL